MNTAMDSSGTSSSTACSSFLFYMLPLIAKSSTACDMSSIYVPLLIIFTFFAVSSIIYWSFPGGPAWGKSLLDKNLKNPGCKKSIPGPRGLPIFGSLLQMGALAHRRLAKLAESHGATRLMALSIGATRMVVSSNPGVAKQLLNSPSFADRPLKQSAQELLFGRAMGFAPYGDYWRRLRRIAAGCLFSPRRIAAHEPMRQAETTAMLSDIQIAASNASDGAVLLRGFVQKASLNCVMQSVFGHKPSSSSDQAELHSMVREGFDLLGAFNWSDHLPFLRQWDPQGVVKRCQKLVPRVNSFVQKIIDEHRANSDNINNKVACNAGSDSGDFVDVLLSLQGEDKLADSDMVAVLWEMIFRGTDTTAILTEWVLAELVLNPEIQRKLQAEIDSICGDSGAALKDSDIERMPYLQAVVNETLRLHPPGPLLSWARLAVHDVEISGYHIPAGTSAMVNMWAITHDPSNWSQPEKFLPERFVSDDKNKGFDVRGIDLRLAPFGAGRRVCPGRALGLATVRLWVGRLVQEYFWMPSEGSPVELDEVLKLSCEMVKPLRIRPVSRRDKFSATTATAAGVTVASAAART